MADAWNRCDECGRFIPYGDFADGSALHDLLEPDSDLGVEKWETLCREHKGNRCKLCGSAIARTVQICGECACEDDCAP